MNRENDNNKITQDGLNQKNEARMNELTEEYLNQNELVEDDLTKEEIEAYLKATDDEIPDLWDKISEGYDMEIQAISKESGNIYTSGTIEEQSAKSNVVDISTLRKYKKKIITKYLLAVAALALLVIIAAPIIKSNTRKYKDKSNDEIKSKDQTMDTEEIRDEISMEDHNSKDEAPIQNESNGIGEIDMIPADDTDSNQNENIDAEASTIEDELNFDNMVSGDEDDIPDLDSTVGNATTNLDDNDISNMQPTEEIIGGNLDSAGNNEAPSDESGYEGTGIYLAEDMIIEIISSNAEESSSLDSASAKLFAETFNSIILEETDYIIDDLEHAYKASVELEDSSMEIYIVYGYIMIDDTTYKADENATAELIGILGY